jgi:putative DNA primase/helicase
VGKRFARFSNTDVGNAARLAFYCGSEFRYVPAWECFITWRGTHWEPDAAGVGVIELAKMAIKQGLDQEAKDAVDDAQKKTIRKWQFASQSRARLEAMVALVKGVAGVAEDHTKLDAEPWLFNCKNGTLDLRTGKLRKHSRLDLLTKCSAVKFDAGASATRWEKFLTKVLPSKAVRGFLQRFLGYCLTGDVSERMFVVMHGGGRNGKSVFLRTVQDVMGPYGCSMPPGLLLAREGEAHPTEIADLFGKRAVFGAEMRKGRVFDEEQTKRITGNDRLKARRMREDYWEYNPTHKLVIAANHKPRVKDATDSFWDRLALIPFEVRIKDNEVDRSLPSKLEKEWSGVLAWLVRGCLEWQRNGLAAPKEVRDATEEYRKDEDRIGQFLTEVCRFVRSERTTNRELAREVRAWCTSQNIYALNSRDLGDRLVERGCERVAIGKDRGWRGLTVHRSSEVSSDTSDTSDASSG